MKITFLIPAYNEAATIVAVLDAVDALGLDREILVVDDGSQDGTAALVEQWAQGNDGVVLLRKENAGKGSALRHGIPHATGDIVVIQDADLEYDPQDVPSLIKPIVDGAADVVYGSRLSGGGAQRAYMFWHLVGNRFLSLVTGVLFNTTLSDMETGYKAFRREVLQALPLTEDQFGIEPEITGWICRRGLRIYEVPISYFGRTYGEGKKITWRDGFRALWVLLRVRLAPSA
ncbi:Undecaprenyl-phosphate 4-deoxy-4-formamido-L-arabinose transferase [Baekduia alba]|uniref:glycosyltransferase family 2 protein n=1 Tax=Baekduia alba TaxID=2997333 RepID=UPI0023409450|nr:glycosyltransferase family 2 protein [Baekduia alba]WCB96570.1 Undecaprenyl-phosphate 4-deoxy-4-formamido-L-arabinose transferase [Baekduia alba]